MRRILLIGCLLLTAMTEAYEVTIRSPEGELAVVEVASEENLAEIVQMWKSHYGTDHEVFVDFMTAAAPTGNTKKKGRNFAAPITPREKEDIGYIVNTLGMASLAKVMKVKPDLKKAGDRVNHVHPLKFLMTIFTDEEMKASISAMQERSWIWDEFFEGLKSSLEEESNHNNMQPSYVSNFADKVGINPNLISSLISQRKWKQFISTLIEKVPRKGDVGRYNM